MSYDINVRPTVITDPEAYWAKVQPWLRVVGQRGGIVKASDEDIKFLAQAAGSRRPGASDPVEVAAGWVEQYGLGPGGDHARSRRRGGGRAGGKMTRVPGFPTKVVDTVGAGDTFMAGFLDGSGQAGRSTWRRRCGAGPPPRRSSAPGAARSRPPRPRWTT